jgi:hypothetical protein
MKHEHKVGIKEFQHNVYKHLQKIDDNTNLVITNRNQVMYTVSSAAFDATTADPNPPVVSSTLATLTEKKGNKNENDR